MPERTDANAGRRGVLVRKYGGSSLASIDRVRAVAGDLVRKRAEGYDLVVVVSAMGRTTDDLLHLARQANPDPPRRELDMLLTVGERVSMSLLSMALAAAGCPAISFTGSQVGIITDTSHTDARIVEVKADRVREALAAGQVVVVAGFQGVSVTREITTLGRGGSDTTAVALAAALRAVRCEILKDVDGVYSADPHRVPGARRHARLSYEQMRRIAAAGSGVIHARAVDYAARHRVPLLVGSSFRGCDREHFLAVLLDARHRVVAVETVAIGCLDASLVHPRELFRAAVVSGAAAVIAAHNHPSGCARPSPDDIGLTGRLARCGRLLGIELLDHIIVGRGEFTSLREHGWPGPRDAGREDLFSSAEG